MRELERTLGISQQRPAERDSRLRSRYRDGTQVRDRGKRCADWGCPGYSPAQWDARL